MISTQSEKKNLKRNIENKTSNFKFVKYAKTYLGFPETLKSQKWCFNGTIKIKGMVSTKKTITHDANIIKAEIKNCKYVMSWPPRTDELEMSNFVKAPNLDLCSMTLLK